MRRERTLQKTLRLLLLTGLAFLASGCGERIPNAAQGIERGILILGNGAEPKTLDPHVATGVTENKIISALTEGLIAYHYNNDNTPEPGAAQSWEMLEDGRVWIFHLQPEGRWSNGDPVTADDFVYTYRRMLTPALAAEYAQMLFVMRGAEDFYNGKLTDFSQVGVQAVDKLTLRIELVGPMPYFLSMLTHYSWFPVHPPTIEKFGGISDREGIWTLPGNFVGNGAFTLKNWKPNQYLEVSKSETYWDHSRVQLNGIIFYPVEDDNTEMRMFRSGLMHVSSTLPSNEIPTLRAERDPTLRIEPYLGTYFYRFNTTRKPLDDPRVRRALTLAIDRETFVERVSKGGQQPTYGYVPPGFNGYQTPRLVSYDPQKARELLAAAGFPEGQGFPRLTILINTSEDHRKFAEAIAAMWRKELGIQLQIENKEWKVYLDAQSSLDFDISRSAWIGDYMDPITFLEMWTTGNGNNDTGWSNPRYDALIREAFASHSVEHHYGRLLEAEHILLDELPIAPLYWYTRVYLADPRVGNWNPMRLDNRNYKYVYFR